MANFPDMALSRPAGTERPAAGTAAAEGSVASTEDTPADPRDAAFGYICRRCSRCCHHKRIQVNPYEVARLARALGQTTGEFRAAWTSDSGTTLRQTESGACVFLGPRGCTVHADRPLVCRLYPLGRHVLEDGTERFSRLEGHPQSAGEVTDRGTIAQFLAAQKAHDFMTAADEYFDWFCAAQRGLGNDPSRDQPDRPAADPALAADLVDMDTAIARHCAASGAAEPHEIEARKRLHLEILYRQIVEHTGGSHDGS